MNTPYLDFKLCNTDVFEFDINSTYELNEVITFNGNMYRVITKSVKGEYPNLSNKFKFII